MEIIVKSLWKWIYPIYFSPAIAYRMLPDFLIDVLQTIAKQLDEKSFWGKAYGTN